MAWIESHQELAEHPKTKRAARVLGISRAQMIGHLHLLWWWSLDYAQDGCLSGYTEQDIAEAAMWDGGAEEFTAALLGCGVRDKPGFLEVDDAGSLHIHDWHDYAGRLINRREAAKSRTRRWRATNAHVTHNERITYATTVPNHTVPTVPNHTVPTKPKHDHAEISEIYEHFKAKIQPDSRKCPRERIRARLKAFTAQELMDGIDHFAADEWWMENNAARGATWFFHSDERSEQFLHLKPRTPSSNGQSSGGVRSGYSQRNHI